MYPNEEQQVRTSGEVWGGVPRISAGNGPARIKAFPGRKPEAETGYTFATSVVPTRTAMSFGRKIVEWREGTVGVRIVGNNPDIVGIEVRVV